MRIHLLGYVLILYKKTHRYQMMRFLYRHLIFYINRIFQLKRFDEFYELLSLLFSRFLKTSGSNVVSSIRLRQLTVTAKQSARHSLSKLS